MTARAKLHNLHDHQMLSYNLKLKLWQFCVFASDCI